VETDAGRTIGLRSLLPGREFQQGCLRVPGIHENFPRAYDSIFKRMELVDIFDATHSKELVKGWTLRLL